MGGLIMDDKTKRKYVMEIKEVPIKTNKSAPIEYKRSEKNYTEEEVKKMMKELVKELKNETDKRANMAN